MDVIRNYFDVKENKLLEQFSIENYLTKDSYSRKKISMLLVHIPNDKNLKNLNSEQMAEYLRVYGKKEENLLTSIVRGIFKPFN